MGDWTTVNQIIARGAVASLVLSALSLMLPVGLWQHPVEVLSIIIVSVLIVSVLTALVITATRSRSSRHLIIVAAAYVVGSLFVGVGGLSWQVIEYGWHRTNVTGYLTWCWVYGLVFLPVNYLVFRWICFPALISYREPRGFEVVNNDADKI